MNSDSQRSLANWSQALNTNYLSALCYALCYDSGILEEKEWRKAGGMWTHADQNLQFWGIDINLRSV